jgi:hypothetical protein
MITHPTAKRKYNLARHLQDVLSHGEPLFFVSAMLTSRFGTSLASTLLPVASEPQPPISRSKRALGDFSELILAAEHSRQSAVLLRSTLRV